MTNQTPVLRKRWYKVAQPHHLRYSKPGKINMCIYLTPALGELAAGICGYFTPCRIIVCD